MAPGMQSYRVLRAYGGYGVGGLRLYAHGSVVAAQAVRAGLLALLVPEPPKVPKPRQKKKVEDGEARL